MELKNVQLWIKWVSHLHGSVKLVDMMELFEKKTTNEATEQTKIRFCEYNFEILFFKDLQHHLELLSA